MGVYGRLLGYARAVAGEIALKVALELLMAASYIGQALACGAAVALVFDGVGPADLLAPVVVAAGCVVARAGLSWAVAVWGKVIGARVKSKIRLMVFNKVMRLGPGYLDDKRTGNVQSVVLDGVESLEPFLVGYVPQLVTVALTGIGIGAFLCTVDLPAGLLAVVLMVLCVVVPYLTVPLVRRSIVDYWRSYADLNAEYIDAIQGMATLKAFNASAAQGERLAGKAQGFYRRQIRNTTFSLLDSAGMLLLTSLVGFVAVAVCAARCNPGDAASVAGVATFLFLAAECARPMLDLNTAWHNSFLGLSVAQQMFDLLDTAEAVREPAEPDTSSLDGGLPCIAFEDVTFTYPGADAPALRHVSFAVEAGRTAAFVGRSGAGKSTVAALLMRFYDPDEGRVLLNGRDARTFGIDYLRGKVAAVFQVPYLFDDTVRANLQMACPQATEAQMRAALAGAGAEKFVDGLPQGLDTVLGERGTRLSGGQRQRIAIARALLKGSPVLVLDEATSSVDARNELTVQRTVEGLNRTRTAVVIAHRLSTVRNADVIFVLEKGALVESGTHAGLLAAGGAYAGLVRAQEEGDARG